MKTCTKSDFHNPEQLTRQQVGEEYRLLLLEEADGRFRYGMGIEAQCVGTPINSELNWIRAEFASCLPTTYRVPLATPLPDGTVLSNNECCWSDEPSASDDMADLDDILGKQGYLNVNYNGITEVEQSASRIAKLLDERADCLAEVMLYRGENGDWTVEAGNPNACVMLGEVPGIIRAEGPCLLEALSNAENALTKREEKPCKKRVYVAGPMSNMPDYNFPAFYSAEESLEKQGYFPINPAELDRVAGYTLERIKELDPAEFQEFLKGAAKRDLDALQQCDAIALLPGWENSKGARAEKAVAEWLGLEVYKLCKFVSNEWELVGPCNANDGAGVFGNLGPRSACVGYNGADAQSGPVDTSSEKALQISDARQPDADGWIPHIPGDPMPCNPGEQVEVKLGNGLCSGFGRVSSSWYWGDSCTKGGVIIAWRQAQSKQPYNSDERAEWGVDAPTATSTPQYASDDPKGAAGAKKAPMWLLPPYALQQTAWVHKHGAVKYLPYNWRGTGVCATTYISAIMRHLDAWRDGEDNDPESGVSHIAHIAASCNILLDAQHCSKLNDDRAKSCQI